MIYNLFKDASKRETVMPAEGSREPKNRHPVVVVWKKLPVRLPIHIAQVFRSNVAMELTEQSSVGRCSGMMSLVHYHGLEVFRLEFIETVRVEKSLVRCNSSVSC